MKTNRFTEKLKTKSSSELTEIAFSNRKFDSTFILAALWELESRNELDEKLHFKLKLLEESIKSEKAIKAYNSHPIPPDMPLSIKLAAVSLYLVLLAELIGLIFLNRTSSTSIGRIIIPSSLISLGAGIFVHLGKTWAKYALYVVFAISILFFVLTISYIDPIDIIQQLLISVSFVLILTKASRNWYKSDILISKNADA